MKLTYRINTDTEGKAESITCLQCGMTSYHPKDIEHRYCGHCHVFHDDLRRLAKVPCFGGGGSMTLDGPHLRDHQDD